MHLSKFAALFILASSLVFLSKPLTAQTEPATPSLMDTDVDENTLHGASGRV